MTVDRPMFTDIQECLNWAVYGYVVSANTVKGAGYVQWQSEDKREREEGEEPPRSRNPDLGGKPRGNLASGQSGMLKAQIQRELDEIELWHVLAKFLHGPERHNARKRLRPLILDRIILMDDRERAAASLLLSWAYGKGKRKLSVAGIAKRTELSRRLVTSIKISLLTEMDALSYRAETRLYNVLRDRGVIL